MFNIALLGKDIACTKLPAVHKAIADALETDINFKCLDVPYDSLGEAVSALKKERYDGFFVTKPYKAEIKKFFPCVEQSVNSVRLSDKTAYNTDGTGFVLALDRCFADWREKVQAVLILGTGGAAHSVVKALTAERKKVYVLGRSVRNALRLIAKYNGAELYTNQPAELVVNCTPLGWNGEDALASFCVLPSFKYAFDLVYGSRTQFLRRCSGSGAQVADGTDMMIYQAIVGYGILLNKQFDVQSVYEKSAQILGEGK